MVFNLAKFLDFMGFTKKEWENCILPRMAACMMCTGSPGPPSVDLEPPICARHCALYHEWKAGKEE